MRIAAKQAGISTVVVEIKCVTVNAKQMTLAVFKQLPFIPRHQIPQIRYDAFWGRVNYHTDQCKHDRSVHLHLIFVNNGELWHTIAFRPFAIRDGEKLSDEERLEIEGYQRDWDYFKGLDQLFIAV